MVSLTAGQTTVIDDVRVRVLHIWAMPDPSHKRHRRERNRRMMPATPVGLAYRNPSDQILTIMCQALAQQD